MPTGARCKVQVLSPLSRFYSSLSLSSFLAWYICIQGVISGKECSYTLSQGHMSRDSFLAIFGSIFFYVTEAKENEIKTERNTPE